MPQRIAQTAGVMSACETHKSRHVSCRLRVLLSIAIVPGLLAGCGSPKAPDENEGPHESEAASVARLLGADLAGAKIVAIRQLGEDRKRLAGEDRDLQIVTIDVDSGALRVVYEASTEQTSRGLSRPCWSPDGRQILFSFESDCWIMDADGSGKRRIIEDDTVFDPSFWRDPATGELCVVYKNKQGRPAYTDQRERALAGQTFRYRLGSRKREKLFDFGCDGGLSLDGTHLAEAYGGCLMVDLRTDTPHVLFDDRQACQASISPDNTYRLMFLCVPHDRVLIHDKTDREVWRLELPPDARQWETPRWSNHPNFCMAVVKFKSNDQTEFNLVLARIEPKELVVLDSLAGGWRAPHLWLPSAAPAARDQSPPGADAG
jgi:hypothetical protein